MWNRKIYCFSIVASPIYIPTNSAGELLFLCILTNTCYFFFLTLAIRPSVRWYFMMVLICISLMMLSIFSSACLPSVFLFGRTSIQILCQFFKLVNVLFLFLMLNCISSLCILDTQSLITIPYQIWIQYPLSNRPFANLFPRLAGDLLILLIVFFSVLAWCSSICLFLFSPLA